MAKIIVIGSGTMGNGIAQTFAQAGNDVILNDLSEEILEKALDNIRVQLALSVKNSLLTEIEAEAVGKKIRLLTDISFDVKDADLVIEAIPEKLELKEILFNKLEEICSEKTIFATNTSGISINLLAQKVIRKDRLVGTHFFMPAHLIPLVEVICGDQTSEATIEKVMALLKDAGKSPVRVRDIPGFIANRLQHALAREAMSLVQKGIATSEGVDEVVKTSLAPRLLFTGPLEQRDFNGLDIHLAIASYLYKDLEDTHVPLKILSDKVEEGKLGVKTGEGFYDWSDEVKEDILAEKNQDLIDVLLFLKEKR